MKRRGCVCKEGGGQLALGTPILVDNSVCTFPPRSILYYVDLGTMSGVVPIDLPVRILIVDVSMIVKAFQAVVESKSGSTVSSLWCAVCIG